MEQHIARAWQGDGSEPHPLSSYISALAARRLVGRHAPLREPEGEQLAAAVLFADISGFTALTERLAQTGPSGVEELTELLNGCFGELVQLVADHGGDVVKFAGDALLALWPADEDLPAVTAQAASCGLAMQRLLQASELAAGTHLWMRIGIGAGQVSAAHLGGELGRWELVVGGPAIAQTCSVEQLARPGDVVLSPEALDQVRDMCAGEQVPGGAGEPFALRVTAVQPLAAAAPRTSVPARQVAEAALRGYVPGAIVARLAAGQSAWLSELRHVSVVFLRLPDLDDITPGTLQRANDIVCAVQAALYEYEGSVDKLGVDDKGATMVAAFGLPPVAHEDDPVRVVQAALGIQASLRRLGVRHAIGVATGRAFCGSVGSDLRREYTMIGGVVNLAARLMQTAIDDVVCDAATQQAAEAKLAFEALPPRPMKGWAEPVPAFRPSGHGRASARSWSVVGRAHERGILAERLVALRDGEGGTLLIEGEAGIGKSRLVDDLVGQATGQPVRTLVGAADAIRSTTPYHAWRPVFESLFEIADVSEPEVRRSRVLDRLRGRPDLERLAPLLSDVLPLELPTDEIVGQLEGQVRADNTRRLLVDALRTASEQQPLLIVVEDAHWCDSASWALAWLVCQRVPSALVVLALRPLAEPVPDEYQRLRRAHGSQQLQLDPLPADDIAALVGQRLGVTSVPQPIADLIGEHAGGNPFFSEELTYALRDTGAITVADGTCRIPPGADLRALSLPDTVQGVVLTRIDRLAPPQQLTLKVASVIGRSFAHRLLRDIHPIAADRLGLPDQLDSLQRRSLVLLEAPEPELAWMFKHVITRDVAYDLMLRAQRRALHRAIAEWYEQRHQAQLPRFYPLLAYHWTRSGVTAKAVTYLSLAGEQALSGAAYREATLFLADALALDQPASPGGGSPEDRLRRARWERQLGEAYLGLGQTGEGRTHLSRALELLGAPLPTTKRQLAGRLLQQLAIQAAHRALPAKAVRRRGRQREESLEASRIYIRLTEVFWFANDTPALGHAGIRALNLAERAGPSPELARAYAMLCLAAGTIPIHPLARMYSRRALEIARTADQLASVAYVRFATSVYKIGTARWDEAQQALDEAEAIFERLGDRRLLGDTWTAQGMLGIYRGQFEAAGALFIKLYDHGVRNENVQHQVWASLGKAACELRCGRPAEAAHVLERMLELLVDHPDPAEQIQAYGLLAAASWRQGEDAAALAAASSAASLMAQNRRPTAFYLFEGYTGVAEVHLDRWAAGDRAPATRQAARQACAALRTFARIFPIGKPRDRLLKGHLLHLSGRPRRARAAWRASLSAAQRLGMPFDAAIAHAELGLSSTGTPQGQRHLEQARTLLRQLGVPHDLTRGRTPAGRVRQER